MSDSALHILQLGLIVQRGRDERRPHGKGRIAMFQFELLARSLQHPIRAVGVQLSAEALCGLRMDRNDVSLTAFDWAAMLPCGGRRRRGTCPLHFAPYPPEGLLRNPALPGSLASAHLGVQLRSNRPRSMAQGFHPRASR
jgi:hypothetical protein